MLTKNQRAEVRIESCTPEGYGVCRLEGRAVFVASAMSGERWEILILKVTASAVWAKGLRLLEPSPVRCEPDCPNLCGGCTLRHMRYEEELRVKKEHVDDCLHRLGKQAVGTAVIHPSPLTERYRNKAIFAVDTVAGQVPVIAGTGTNDLRRTLRRGRLAADLGADAQLVVTPYYNKTTQDGLVDYYTQVADASRLPVILYNVPGRTGLNMRPHPNIAGVKEASGDLAQLALLAQSGVLPVYCGSDRLNAAALQLGAVGVISVISNLLPQDVAQLCSALKKGCVATANARQRAMNPLIDALFAETSPAPVKAESSRAKSVRRRMRLFVCSEIRTNGGVKGRGRGVRTRNWRPSTRRATTRGFLNG